MDTEGSRDGLTEGQGRPRESPSLTWPLFPTRPLHVQRELGADRDPLPGLEPGVPAAEAGCGGQPQGDSQRLLEERSEGGGLREWGPRESRSNAGTPRHPAVLGNLAFLSWEDDKH